MKRLILGIMLLTFASLSQAGMMCAGGYSGNVSDSLGCELGSTNNDFLNPVLQVNTDALFGETDWEFIFRSGSSQNETQTTVSDLVMYDNLYGTFTIDWTGWDSLLFIQKDGAGDPSTYVSWLLDPADMDLSYDFSSPFTNPISGGLKDISHLTWYGVEGGGGGTNQVPEPAPLALMGLGLLLMRSQIKRHQSK